jgi:anti-anti-sigma factor
MPVTSPTAPMTPSGCRAATFATRWLPQSAAVITVHGELDAASAPEFAAYAMRHTFHTRRLVVDLSGVEFFGTAGLAALEDLDGTCSAKSVAWGLTSGTAVDRLLKLSKAALPIYPTVSKALTELDAKTTRSLQLVPQSR